MSDDRNDKGTESQPTKPTETPSLVDVINTIADRADPFVKILAAFAERSLKANQVEVKFKTGMAVVGVVLVAVIVGVSGFLTYQGKLDSSGFTFLIGIVVGSFLTLIRDFIRPPSE